MSDKKFLFGRIFNLDFKEMMKISKAVCKKADKSRFSVICDMIYCGFKYQAGYHDYQEFELYNVPKELRSTYLTIGKNNAIVKKYNDKNYFHVFENKIEFNETFSDFLNRDWINLETASLDEFAEFLKKNPVIIAKVIDGEGGFGIEKYSIEDGIEKIYNTIKSKKQYLVEAYVKQHKDLNRLYSNSVNSMRMFTIVKNGKGYFLHAVLKIGNGGVIDNFSSGGMYTFVDDNGVVDVPAIDKDDIIHEIHPISKEKIVGFTVPMFKEATKLVEKAAEVVPQVAYVGWDVAISESGPVIIEGNCYPGVFQKRASFNKDGKGLLEKYSKFIEI